MNINDGDTTLVHGTSRLYVYHLTGLFAGGLTAHVLLYHHRCNIIRVTSSVTSYITSSITPSITSSVTSSVTSPWLHHCVTSSITSLLQGGWTALMWSCYKGRSEAVEILLENGANPNVKGDVSIGVCVCVCECVCV